jgi:maltoporin
MEEIEKLRLGDVGTIFRIRIIDVDGVVDLHDCTVKQIIFKKPDGSYVEQEAEFYTDGSDGYIQYTSVSGDLDQAGKWRIQSHVEFSINDSWHTTTDSFLVSENLEDE